MTGLSRRVLVCTLLLIASGCGSGDATNSDGSTGATTRASDTASAGDDVIEVMPIGDSITAGPYYRPYLVRAVAAAGCPIDFVGTFNGTGDPPLDDAAQLDLDHQAVGGATSAQIAANIDEWLQDQRPDIALVYLGTNDFYSGIDRATTIDNLEAVMLALRRVNPGVAIILAEIMPSVAVEQGVAALDAEIVALGQRMSSTASPIEVVDMASGVDIETDLVDGVHPNDAQSQELASRWAKALDGLLGDRCDL